MVEDIIMYECLRERCSILLGEFDETVAKTKLLKNRLNSKSELFYEASSKLADLEDEMAEHIVELEYLEGILNDLQIYKA